jgi:L-lactate dehydrogenase complex protein LldG
MLALLIFRTISNVDKDGQTKPLTIRKRKKLTTFKTTEPIQNLEAHSVTSTENQENGISLFRERVEAQGGQFASLSDLAEVRDYITRLALASASKRVVACGGEFASSLFSTENLQRPFEFVAQEEVPREAFFEALKTADIGVAAVDLAVAETGTLITVTSDESERLTTALPRIHVAVVPRSRLVASLHDAELVVSEALMRNSNVTVSLISAPSGTSDIGDTLIRGVHGPKELHVLLMDQALPGGA